MEFSEDDGGVMTAKAEAIGERDLNGHGPGVIRHVIEIARGIGCVVVDRRRDLPMHNGQTAHDRLAAASRTDHVAGHRLRR